MQRRAFLPWLAGMALSGCGFRLRGDLQFPFQTIALQPANGGAVLQDLQRALSRSVQVLAPEAPLAQADLVFYMLQEAREKTVVGLNSSGQVRELQLRLRVSFKLSQPSGTEVLPATDLVQQRDISYNEAAALAKESEEALLYRDMQGDMVQQIMRRLASLRYATSR